MLKKSFVIANVLILITATSAAPAPTGGYSVTKKIPIPGQGKLGLPHGGRGRPPTLRLARRAGGGSGHRFADGGGQHSEHARRPRDRDCAGTRPRIRQQRPVLHRHNFRSEDAEAHRRRSDRPEARRHHLRSRHLASFRLQRWQQSATAIDAASGKVAGTVDLGGGPEFAAADGNGFVYDNLEDESLVLKIDSRKLTVEQRWPTAPCASPSSMAMDRANRRLFLGCRSKVMAVMNADTGQVITTLPIGDHVDATAFDPETKLIFNSNGEGTITVIREDSPDKYSVVETVKTLPRAKTMALDPKTHQLFLSTAESGQFEVLVVGK